MIGGHMRPHWLAEAPLTRRAMYRFFRDTKDYGVDILLLSMADHLATHGPEVDLHNWVERLGLISQMFDVYFSQHEEVVAPPPLVNGNDIMRELGLPPGKQIGVILEAIREAQASGEVTSREDALAVARRVLTGQVMSEELISPAAMMDLLHSPYPKHMRADLRWASLEELRDLYRERKDDPQVQLVRSSLNRAIDEWNDEQIEVFWVNYLLELPQSDEFRAISAQERRIRLRQLYNYLF
jgi:hypothetical protein